MSRFVIRRMQLDDVRQVQLLDCMSFPLPWSLNAYRYEVENQGSRAWVCEHVVPADHIPVRYYNPLVESPQVLVKTPGDKAIIAMLVIWLILDEIHIATLAVHPDFRRLGIARMILRTALDDAAREGALSALLEVRAGNTAAQALYRGFGFEVVGRRPAYYRDNNEDALLMTLPDLSLRREPTEEG